MVTSGNWVQQFKQSYTLRYLISFILLNLTVSANNYFDNRTVSIFQCRYGEKLLVLETLSLKAIDEMLELWKQYEGKPFDPEKDIQAVIGKIMSSLVSRFLNTSDSELQLI